MPDKPIRPLVRAHHIKAAAEGSAGSQDPENLPIGDVCAFQPHTYTRTKALFEEFVRELKLPDVLILAEIYAAREQNDIGISSNDLARRIPGAIYCPTLDKVTEALRAAAQPGDLIITVGAGDIYKAGEKLLREN